MKPLSNISHVDGKGVVATKSLVVVTQVPGTSAVLLLRLP